VRKVILVIVVTLLIMGHQAILADKGFTNTDDSYVTEDGQYIYIGNQHLELVFQKTDGELYSIIHKETGTDFITEKNAWWSLYSVMYYQGDQAQYIHGSQARSFNYSHRSTENGKAIDLQWTGFNVGPTYLNMSVEVSIEVKEESPLSYGTISIDNDTGIMIEALLFPSISGLGQISSEADNDFLVFPSMSGYLFQDPVHNFTQNTGWGWELYYPSGYANMQFAAYYSSEKVAGLYLASSDTQGYSKYFSFGRPENWMSFALTYSTPLTSSNNLTLPYSIVIGVFSGDWYTAAQIYRNWAINQWWCQQGAVYQRPDTPALFKRMASLITILTHLRTVNVTNDGTVSEIVKGATDYLDIPVMVSWWGWEKDGWYENYPDVFPPVDGWDFFDDEIIGIHQNNGYVLACICTDFYSTEITSWENAEEHAVMNRDGSHMIIKMTPPLVTTYAVMDPSTEFFQDSIYNLSLTLVNHGVDFLWMDGFPIVTHHLCYDPSHSHLPGGGNWWFQGYREMFENIRESAKEINPDFAMSAEGMAEVYIPYFDCFNDPTIIGISPYSFTNLIDTSKVEYIPLWDTVYHDYIISYSTHVFIKPQEYHSDLDFYTWGLGTNLIRGKILQVWVNRTDTFLADPKMAEYYRRAVQSRFSYASQFLIYGQMLQPPTIDVPDFRISGAQDIPYTLNDYPPFNSPSVLSSLYQSPSGDAGYIFTNISNELVSFSIDIIPEDTFLSADDLYTIIQTRNGVPSIVETDVYLPLNLTVNVDPLDVLLIKVAPSGSIVAPTISADNATDITIDSAVLNGALTSLGTAGSVQVLFEWDSNTDYGNEINAGIMTNTGPFEVSISGLDDDTAYHFRVKAIGDDMTYSDDLTFHTPKVETPVTTPGDTQTPPDIEPSTPLEQPQQSATPVPEESQPAESNNTPLIAGIVGGIALLTLFSLFILRKKSRSRNTT
jgi:hypothetical protein